MIVTRTTKYEPWARDGAVGCKVTRLSDGAVGYVYLNPSFDEDPETKPDVFVYTGPHGDPAQDSAWHYYAMDDDVFGGRAPRDHPATAADEGRRERHLSRLRELLPGLDDPELLDRGASLYHELLEFSLNDREGMIVLRHGPKVPVTLPRWLAWLRRPLVAMFGTRQNERLRFLDGNLR
jgi:hypothetical protein